MFSLTSPSIPRALPMNSLPRLRHSNHYPFPSSPFHTPLSSSLSFPSSLVRTYSSPPRSPNDTFGTLFSSLVKATCTFIAATAFSFMIFQRTPAIAAPLSPSAAESSIESDNDKEEVKVLLDTLLAYLAILKSGPDIDNWLLVMSKLHRYKNSPTRIIYSEEYFCSIPKNRYKDSKYFWLMRGLGLLMGQIRFIEDNIPVALKACQALVDEDPTDFRPYFCQGIIYTLLRNNAEARIQFDKSRALLPNDHPCKDYFDLIVSAAKFFSSEINGRTCARG